MMKKAVKLIFHIIHYALKMLFDLVTKIRKSITKRMRFSITFKTTVTYTILFSIVLILISGVILGEFYYFIINNSQKEIYKEKKLIENVVGNSNINKVLIDNLTKDDNLHLVIFNDDKKILYSKDEQQYKPDANSNIDVFYHQNDGANRDTLVLISKINISNEGCYLKISKDMDDETQTFIIAAIILFATNLISIIIIIVVGWKNSKKVLSPIDVMTKTVKNININDLNIRLDIGESKDELKELAETFNEMIDRIEAAYTEQNRFVSDASHELRTPISVIQGYADLLDRWGKEDKKVLQESIDAIKSEAHSMKDLIEKLLFLARGDKNTQKLNKRNFFMDELIKEIIKETKLINQEHEILNESNIRVEMYGDRSMIKEAIRIFIDNSLKYTPREGIVKINTYSGNNEIKVFIEDSGIGIGKDDIAHIFDRFYRVDKSRTKNSGGTGLGLSIAKWIIGKHKGTITVESKLNEGTKIFIALPLN